MSLIFGVSGVDVVMDVVVPFGLIGGGVVLVGGMFGVGVGVGVGVALEFVGGGGGRIVY